MPDNQDPDENSGDGSVGNSTIQEMRKQIKDLGSQMKAALAEAESAKAEVAEKDKALAGYTKSAVFDRLNIPPDKAGKLFRDTYDGELDDAVILAKAAEYGIVAAAPTAPQPTIPGIDQDAWARQQQALSGTASNAPPNAMDAIKSATSAEALSGVLKELGLFDPSQG